MSDKLTEVKQGYNRVEIVGRAHITSNSFASPSLNAKGNWLGIPRQNGGFSIKVGENTEIFLNIDGGRMAQSNVIKVRPRTTPKGEKMKMLEINFDDRFDTKKIDEVAYNDIMRANLNKDGDKQFIDPIDFQEYLSDNIADGDLIKVIADMNYSKGKPWDFESRTYRNINVRQVFKMEPQKVKDDEGNETEVPVEEYANLKQTVFLTSDSLDSDWKDKLEDNGEIEVFAKVPVYIGNAQDEDGKYTIEYKKTVALPVQLVYRGKERSAERVLVVEEGKVREALLNLAIQEGSETVTGDIEITPEIQELIDDGVMTIEDVQKDVTVRGARKSELVVLRPEIKRLDDGTVAMDIDDEKYEMSALNIPSPEPLADKFNPDEEESVFQVDDTQALNMDDDNFLDMFA